jgi:hypothetical protein
MYCVEAFQLANHLRTFPNIVAVLGILLDDGQYTASDRTMRFREIAVDLLQSKSYSRCSA